MNEVRTQRDTPSATGKPDRRWPSRLVGGPRQSSIVGERWAGGVAGCLLPGGLGAQDHPAAARTTLPGKTGLGDVSPSPPSWCQAAILSARECWRAVRTRASGRYHASRRVSPAQQAESIHLPASSRSRGDGTESGGTSRALSRAAGPREGGMDLESLELSSSPRAAQSDIVPRSRRN